MKTAILVDGGFYRRRAQKVWGSKSPKDRADELEQYCKKHLKQAIEKDNYLYRIFYYDCPPYKENIYHPLLQKDIHFAKTDLYKWMTSFLEELKRHRKFALRLGFLSATTVQFDLNQDKLKKLLRNDITISDLTENDFHPTLSQKGVDMKIGVDIASLAYKRQVDRIVLISDDSDFVPAAKLARREGIDFILDPMWNHVNSNLFEHVDGIRSCFPNPSTTNTK